VKDVLLKTSLYSSDEMKKYSREMLEEEEREKKRNEEIYERRNVSFSLEKERKRKL